MDTKEIPQGILGLPANNILLKSTTLIVKQRDTCLVHTVLLKNSIQKTEANTGLSLQPDLRAYYKNFI